MKQIMTFTILFIIIIIGCSNKSNTSSEVQYNTSIKRVGGCQYVLASRASYSTAIVHHAKCDNHGNNK